MPPYCASCGDTEVSDPKEVCPFCLASHPEDWIGRWTDYNRMIELAFANNQRPVYLHNEAQMLLEGVA